MEAVTHGVRQPPCLLESRWKGGQQLQMRHCMQVQSGQKHTCNAACCCSCGQAFALDTKALTWAKHALVGSLEPVLMLT
jgi:hypothetical protein